MTTPLLLGVDVGTGSARAGLHTASGTLLGRGERRLRCWQAHGTRVEQSSDDVWSAVCAAVREARRAAAVAPEDVAGIGFDATCSLVALGRDGTPVGVGPEADDARNVIVWMDHRAEADAAEINASGHRVLDYVGGAISPEMHTPKLRWLKRELPDAWRRVHHWMDLSDFLTWRASGSDDRSLCSTVCKWTYLGHERAWDTSYFERIGLADLTQDGFARLGRNVRVPGDRVGGLSPQAARELGLRTGTPVAASLIDAHAGALGTLGALGPEVPLTRRLALVAGTSACHLLLSEVERRATGVWGPYFEALLPEHWLLEGGLSASGALVDLVLRMHPAGGHATDPFAVAESALVELERNGRDPVQLVADRHVQPNVLGNRSPLADPALRGGLAGWTLRADAEDLGLWYLASLQSLAYATRHVLDTLHEAGVRIELVVASGGSASSVRWCQTHADALGIPVAVTSEPDGVLLGSAMLGSVAAGVHSSLRIAMGAMSRVGRVYTPRADTAKFHERKYAVYRRMLDDHRAYRAMMSERAN